MVLLILVFRVIAVIQTIHLSEQPPDQRGSDNQGCTVIKNYESDLKLFKSCNLKITLFYWNVDGIGTSLENTLSIYTFLTERRELVSIW